MLAAGLGGCQTMSDITGSLTSKAEAGPRPIRAAPSKSMASATAPIPRMPTRRCATARRCAPPASAPRPPPCSSRRPSPIPATRRCSPPTAARSPTTAISSRRFDVLEPRAYARQSGLAHPVGAGHRARPDGPARRSAPLLRERAEASCPTSPRCCPISACPTCCPRNLPKAEETLRRAYAQRAGPTRGCGRISRLVVGLQGRFAEAETIAKADLPPDEAAANVAYLRQMLSRKDDPRTAARATPVVARTTDQSGRSSPATGPASASLAIMHPRRSGVPMTLSEHGRRTGAGSRCDDDRSEPAL